MFRKKIFRVILLMGCLASQTVSGYAFTQPETIAAAPEDIVPDVIYEGFYEVARSESQILYLNRETLGIQIENVETGYVYSSIKDELEDMNETWEHFIRSGITIDYIDTTRSSSSTIRLPLSSSGADIDIREEKNGFTASLSYSQGFQFELHVSLAADTLFVEIPLESIEENISSNLLHSLYVYPFLGSTAESEDSSGYLFVPDGCGALIRTGQGEAALITEPYIKRIYGDDWGMGTITNSYTEDLTLPGEQIYIPVFGHVHQAGGNGLVAIIEEGDIYGEIQAYKSGMSTPFNYITARYIFRDIYTRSISQNGSNSILVPQDERNPTGISVQYKFLQGEEANYVGMARAYQEYLKEKEVLADGMVSADSNGIPLKLEFLASEQKKRFIGYGNILMTGVSDVEQILEDFSASGISNITSVILGYNKGGPWDLTSSVSFGSGDWLRLIERERERGNLVYFYANYMAANDTSKGFSRSGDTAQAINRTLIQSLNLFLSPSFVYKQYGQMGNKFLEAGADHIALDYLGDLLYSDYNRKHVVSRSDVRDLYSDLKIEGLKQAFYGANSYLWENAEEIFNIPMSSSQYLLFTDTVPFLQIVLKGYIPYYSSALNFNHLGKEGLLKLVEYGAYPSYYLTMEDPVQLLDTDSTFIYTSMYDRWADQITEEYRMINEAMLPLEGLEMVGRNVMSDGVVEVIYSEQISLLVNYTQEPYIYKDQEIAPLEFLVFSRTDGSRIK